MNIYQIIYNSSASSIDGASGFGVRCVSEGTPAEYVKMVKDTSSLRSYGSGKFSLAPAAIIEDPKKIYEYPKSFYYKSLKVNEKRVFLVARVVSTCFDHSFYASGKATRPGNYLAHILVAEEFPGKSIFSIISDECSEAGFLPKDWSPSVSNNEMVALSVGKAQPLPVIVWEGGQSSVKCSKSALDLLFSYRLALKENKPIMVSMQSAATPETLVRFMQMLPDERAEECTFVTNHQIESYAKDAKVTFVNEYYSYPISTTICTHINLLREDRQADRIESVWRPILEDALSKSQFERASRLVRWIFSPMAEDNCELRKEANAALFDYYQYPETFTLETVDTTDGILPLLSKYISSGAVPKERLCSLVMERARKAADLQGFIETVGYCEKLGGANIDASEAIKLIRELFTPYLKADARNLYSAYTSLGGTILCKYSIVEAYPNLLSILPQLMPTTTDQLISFAKLVEKSPRARVEAYLSLLDKAPQYIKEYSALLEADAAEAAELDYIRAFSRHTGESSFAPLFFRQIKREAGSSNAAAQIKSIAQIVELNSEFTKMILSDESIYQTLLRTVKLQISETNYDQSRRLITEYVFRVIDPESTVGRHWSLLLAVLDSNCPEGKTLEFYKLSKEIMHIASLKAVASQCVGLIPDCEFEAFAQFVKDNNLLDDSVILDSLFASESVDKRGRVLIVSKVYEYAYEKIYGLLKRVKEADSEDMPEMDPKKAKALESEINADIKQNFPKLYSEHKKEEFAASFKSIFQRKK